jgi:hypothetical protein
MKSIKVYSDDEFEEVRARDKLEAGQGYRVGDGYAFSPDGIACYWYETLEELLEQHG